MQPGCIVARARVLRRLGIGAVVESPAQLVPDRLRPALPRVFRACAAAALPMAPATVPPASLGHAAALQSPLANLSPTIPFPWTYASSIPPRPPLPLFEALPFLVLGSLVSACMEVFVPRAWVERRCPNRCRGRWPLAALAPAHLRMRVVPVVRRMMGKGVPVPAAVAYMLAAPVVNWWSWCPPGWPFAETC